MLQDKTLNEVSVLIIFKAYQNKEKIHQYMYLKTHDIVTQNKQYEKTLVLSRRFVRYLFCNKEW